MGCPSAEAIACYIDRRLSLAERAIVDAHLVHCPRCVEVISNVVKDTRDMLDSMAALSDRNRKLRREH